MPPGSVKYTVLLLFRGNTNQFISIETVDDDVVLDDSETAAPAVLASSSQGIPKMPSMELLFEPFSYVTLLESRQAFPLEVSKTPAHPRPVYLDYRSLLRPVSSGTPLHGINALPPTILGEYTTQLTDFNFDSVSVAASFLRSCTALNRSVDQLWNHWEPDHLELLKVCGGTNCAGLSLLALPLFLPHGGKLVFSEATAKKSSHIAIQVPFGDQCTFQCHSSLFERSIV